MCLEVLGDGADARIEQHLFHIICVARMARGLERPAIYPDALWNIAGLVGHMTGVSGQALHPTGESIRQLMMCVQRVEGGFQRISVKGLSREYVQYGRKL